MEHAQRALGTAKKANRDVLILILMEHAQRALPLVWALVSTRDSLNPYFNGTCSKSSSNAFAKRYVLREVLILILMEHAQREAAEFLLSRGYKVLILILMEHAQREHFL